jgi:cyclic pyranopterin phosphate synthase
VKDRFGRDIHLLRISVTDRCNFRCEYCVSGDPSGGRMVPGEALLSDDEVVRVAEIFASLGFHSWRVTGGEPLVRPGIGDLVARLRAVPGNRRTGITTNGFYLTRHLDELVRARVTSVNVSLDTLDPARFERVCKGPFAPVWEGVQALLASPVPSKKLNCVMAAGLTDGEIDDLVALTRRHDVAVRFIEVMPFGRWEAARERGPSAAEVIERLRRTVGLSPNDATVDGAGPAEYWRVPGSPGVVGFIHPVSDKFCSACNRMRLTADGRLKGCLLTEEFVPLRDLVRAGTPDAEIRARVERAIWDKAEKHQDVRLFDMKLIGG